MKIRLINTCLDPLAKLGQWSLTQVESLGLAGLFLARCLWSKPRLRKSFPLLLEQLYFLGVLSLTITIVAGLFLGMVVSLQGYYTLNDFGATQQLGQLLALTILRELGPVLMALLFAGRAGSALTAEIGFMKISEQLASMEMMGVDPLGRVLAPRFWAALISNVILSLIFSTVAILSGYWVGVFLLNVDDGLFWSTMRTNVVFSGDILQGLIKSFLFGWVIAWIAVFQGYHSPGTAEGVGRMTTRTVVYSSLVVLALDFILTAIMMNGY